MSLKVGSPVPRPVVARTVDRSKLAEKALDKLVTAAPEAIPGIPYRAVSTDAIDKWLKTYFGPMQKMTPKNADIAARLLEEAGCGVAMGTRSYMHELVAHLDAIAASVG